MPSSPRSILFAAGSFGAPGKINLYVGKLAVKFNIPEAEAVDRLIDLITEHGKWIKTPAPA